MSVETEAARTFRLIHAAQAVAAAQTAHAAALAMPAGMRRTLALADSDRALGLALAACNPAPRVYA
jgi:hypothetical protein